MIALLHTYSITVNVSIIVAISYIIMTVVGYYCSPDIKGRGQVVNIVLCIYGLTN